MSESLKAKENAASLDVRDIPRIKTRKSTGSVTPLLKFAHLKRHLVDDLKTGRLGPGAAMPSELRLAEKFETSRTTVRQALAEMEQEGLIRREKGRGTFVSDKVQQRVQVAAGTFAFILKGKDPGLLSLIRGFEQACRSMRHEMLLYNTENDISQQADVIFNLSHRGIAGVAILPVNSPPTPHYHIAAFQDRQIPVVFCSRRVDEARGPMVGHRSEKDPLLERAFAEKGHRRVAMVFHERVDGLTDEWAIRFRKSLHTFGVELPEEFVYTPETSQPDPSVLGDDLSEKLERMLGSENPPTAIFVAHDVFAQSVYFALDRMGLKVPEDISLVGLGDVDREGAFLQRLTSVVTDRVAVGRQAVETLDQMQSGQRNLLDSETIITPMSLSDGQTLGPPPATPVRYCRESQKVIRA